MSTPDAPQEIRISGTKPQLEFWKDQTTPELAIVGPLGCGKTYALGTKAMMLALANPHAVGILMVPTYAMAERVHKQEWPALWESWRIPVTIEEKYNAFRMPWGTIIWIISAEEPDRLGSINAGFAVIDEPAQMQRRAYDMCVARVRAPKAQVRQTAVGGTPEGLNWFADLYGTPAPGRRTIWATEWPIENAHYPATLKRIYGYDPALLDTYGRGKFTSLFGGGCYRSFSPATHVVPKIDYTRELPIVLACDFNIDAMRWLVCQFGWDEIRILDEIAPGPNTRTEDAVREFVSRFGARRGRVVVTGDASGKARKTSGSKVDYQIIRETLRQSFDEVSECVSDANPRQRDRVDAVNYHLAGRGRMVRIASHCVELIKDLERNAWKKGTSDIDKTDPLRTHAADAFGYAIWNLARPSVPLRRDEAQKMPALVAHHDPVLQAVW